MTGLAGSLAGGNIRYAATSAPTVSSVTPNHGAVGDALVIAGTNLNAVRIVQVHGVTCYDIVHTSDIRIDCKLGLCVTGATLLTVRSRGGSATKAFTVDNNVGIDSITPDHGSALGGILVTIVLDRPVASIIAGVTFDGNDGTDLTVVDASTITVVAPAGAVGDVDVVVDGGDYGDDTATAGYHYDNAVNITNISPATGSTDGGTTVTITFDEDVAADVAGVTFAGDDATDLAVAAPNAVTCTTPAESAGLVDVVVDAGDSGTDTATNGFEYVAP